MTLIIWIIIFLISLTLLVKSADWLLQSSEKMGLAIGLSPFIVGITIVAVGTSLPELISSIVAVFQGVSEVVVANVVGSNIANILLIVGASAIVAKRLVVSKDLIDLDLPLIALGTTIFLMVAWDGSINFIESIILLATYGIYLLFSILYKDDSSDDKSVKRPKVLAKDFFLLFIGIVGLSIGAKYLIDSVVALSTILNIGTGVITITAVAVGTSLPELLVSVKAAMKGQSEVALGNIFGSNIFNVLVVTGLPGIFSTLNIDPKTLAIGFPMLIVATFLFIISGISKRIHLQEGILYLIIYALFMSKLFELF